MKSEVVRFEITRLRRPISIKNGKIWASVTTIRRDFGPTPIARGSSVAKAPPLAARAKRKTPGSQALAPQGPRKGEEEHTDRHAVKSSTYHHCVSVCLVKACRGLLEEEQRDRHTVKAHVEEKSKGLCPGACRGESHRIQSHESGEGGNGKKRG